MGTHNINLSPLFIKLSSFFPSRPFHLFRSLFFPQYLNYWFHARPLHFSYLTFGNESKGIILKGLSLKLMATTFNLWMLLQMLIEFSKGWKTFWRSNVQVGKPLPHQIQVLVGVVVEPLQLSSFHLVHHLFHQGSYMLLLIESKSYWLKSYIRMQFGYMRMWFGFNVISILYFQ